MKAIKGLKRDTQLVILSVLVLTIVSLRVSYSAFFSVKTQSSIQEITAGTLVVSAEGTNKITNELMPTTKEEIESIISGTMTTGDAASQFITLTVNNTGNVKSDYSVSLSNDTIPSGVTGELLSFNYLYVAIYDVTNSTWLQFKDTSNNGTTYTTIGSLATNNVAPIIKDSIETGNSAKQYKVYVWLSEDVPTSEIGKLVYLKLDVKSVASDTGGTD